MPSRASVRSVPPPLSLPDALPIFPGLSLPNYQLSHTLLPIKAPTGPWRAPRSCSVAWVIQSFLHELAVAAGRDHRDFLLELMGEPRSEEHTSELQSPCNLVCRLVLPSAPSPPLFPYPTLFRSSPGSAFLTTNFRPRCCPSRPPPARGGRRAAARSPGSSRVSCTSWPWRPVVTTAISCSN